MMYIVGGYAGYPKREKEVCEKFQSCYRSGAGRERSGKNDESTKKTIDVLRSLSFENRLEQTHSI